MSDASPDLVARGRAIFDRLRSQSAPPDAEVEHDELDDSDAPPAAERPPTDAPAAHVETPVEAEPEPAPTGPVAPPSTVRPVDEPDSGPAEAPQVTPEPEPASQPPSPSMPVAPVAAVVPVERTDVADAPPEDHSGPVDAAPATPAPPAPLPVSAPPPGPKAQVTAPELLVRVAPPEPEPEREAEPVVRVAPPEPEITREPEPVLVSVATVEETPPAAVEPDAAPAPAPVPAPSVFARPLPRIIAIANQKGGVGKTTTAVNLGAALAVEGYRVLVVDLDPQGNASTGLGINTRDLQASMYDVVLHDTPIDDCIEPTSVRNLFVAPASLDLAGAEIELVPAFSRELRLKRALDEVHDEYDFVFIDCPPSLGLLTVNSLAAASEVLVPIQCEYYALEGLGQLLRNVGLVQKNLNPTLEISIIVLVMYDARTKLADQVVREVREHFGDKVCRAVVPRTVRLSEAPSFGQPIIAFDPSSRGSIAYRELAKEVSGGTPQRAG